MALTELARILEALLFLSADAITVEDLAEAADCDADELADALAELDRAYAPGRARAGAQARRRRHRARDRSRRRGGRAPPARQAAHAAADAGAGRDARDRRLPAARLAPGDHPHPRRLGGLGVGHAARSRLHRGGRPLAVRRRPVPHDRSLPEAVRARHAQGAAERRRMGPHARGGGRPARPPPARGRAARGRPGGPVARGPGYRWIRGCSDRRTTRHRGSPPLHAGGVSPTHRVRRLRRALPRRASGRRDRQR